MFLGANEILLSDAIGYIHGVMPWLMGVGGLFFCDYTLKGLGHPKFSTGLMTGTFILNIALSLLFVVLFDWGTLGAGMGTGISFTVGTIVYIVIIWRILKKCHWFATPKYDGRGARSGTSLITVRQRGLPK